MKMEDKKGRRKTRKRTEKRNRKEEQGVKYGRGEAK